MDPVTNDLALARHYLSIEQPTRALDALGRGQPNLEDVDFWLIRAQALFELERYDEAAGAASEGLARDPLSVSLLRLLAQIRRKQQDLAGAEAALLAALRVDPADPELLCDYAVLTAQGGQYDKAGLLMEEASRLAPDDPYVARVRALLQHVRGDDRAAMREARHLLHLSPGDLFGHYFVGTLMLLKGRIGRAGRYLGAAARVYPRDDILVKAQTQRYLANALMWPLRLITSPGRSIFMWLLAIAIYYGLRRLHMDQAAAYFSYAYLALCVYSWIAPPLLRRWYRRRGYDIDD